MRMEFSMVAHALVPEHECLKDVMEMGGARLGVKATDRRVSRLASVSFTVTFVNPPPLLAAQLPPFFLHVASCLAAAERNPRTQNLSCFARPVVSVPGSEIDGSDQNGRDLPGQQQSESSICAFGGRRTTFKARLGRLF